MAEGSARHRAEGGGGEHQARRRGWRRGAPGTAQRAVLCSCALDRTFARAVVEQRDLERVVVLATLEHRCFRVSFDQLLPRKTGALRT